MALAAAATTVAVPSSPAEALAATRRCSGVKNLLKIPDTRHLLCF